MSCLNCGGGLYDGEHPYQVDLLVCRSCQRYPAVQLRLLLDHQRAQLVEFEQAWEFALSRIRWPHDTTHRREWKSILRHAKQREVWASAYRREPVDERGQVLVHLALAVAA